MTDRAKRIYGIGGTGPSGMNTGVLLWLLLAGSTWLGVFLFWITENRGLGGMVVIALIMSLGLGITYRGYRRTRLNC